MGKQKVKWINQLKPLQLLIYGYLSILILGFLLLCIPWFQHENIKVLDNFFIATSALSTTGLATISVGESYNFFGELIVTLLIQIGGLGYMSLGSFVTLMRKRKLDKLESDLIANDFSLPKKFSVLSFIRSLVWFTLAIELFGAIFLSLIFWHQGVPDPIWQGIFHSISAFCTAGFSLLSTGFEPFSDNFYLNFVISVLSICGAIGFIVFTDLFEMLRGRKEKITFTSRIILKFTFWGIVLGTLVLFLSDINMQQFAPEKRLMIAFFQSMSAFTTVGFNTYPIGSFVAAPLFFMLLLMIVGASPSGTGGGMKSTTITALFAQLKSTFNGTSRVIYLGKEIPHHRVSMATSNFFFYVIVICIGTYLLLLVQPQEKFQVLFEAVSALGTVGLSTGITADLTVMGKVIVIILMFLGRIGPLSFGIALFSPDKYQDDLVMEDIAI